MDNHRQEYFIRDGKWKPYLVKVVNMDTIDRTANTTNTKHLVGVHCGCRDVRKPNEHRDLPSLVIRAAKVFIGPSPGHKMHKNLSYFDQGNPELRGNTILVELPRVANQSATNQHTTNQNTYVWIGSRGIEKFTTTHPIVEFESPISEGAHPQPWARDSQGNYYLMDSSVILINKSNDISCLEEKILKVGNPYMYYTKEKFITCIVGENQSFLSKCPEFSSIIDFYIGHTPCQLFYDPFPEKTYDMICGQGELTIDKTSGMTILLTREKYTDLMKSAGKTAGFEPLNMEIIHNSHTNFTVNEL